MNKNVFATMIARNDWKLDHNVNCGEQLRVLFQLWSRPTIKSAITIVPVTND